MVLYLYIAPDNNNNVQLLLVYVLNIYIIVLEIQRKEHAWSLTGKYGVANEI